MRIEFCREWTPVHSVGFLIIDNLWQNNIDIHCISSGSVGRPIPTIYNNLFSEL
jgi:hypothetical protein